MTFDRKIFAGSEMEGSNEAFDEYIWSSLFPVRYDGTASYIGIYSKASGNIKYSVYDNDSPPNLLRSAEVAVTGDQWNFFALSSSLSLSYGDSVWINLLSDTSGGAGYTSQYSGTTLHYRSQTYSGYSYPATFDWATGTENSYAQICAILIDAVPTFTKKIIYYGDSITKLNTPHQEQIIQYRTLDFEQEALGLSGETAASLLSDWSTNIGSMALGSGENVFCLLAGINDLVATRLPADIFADLEDIWDAAYTAGFDKVVAMTVLPYQYLGGAEAARLTLNNLIRGSSSYDYLADIADITALQTPSSTYYYSDGLHLTTSGSAIVETAITQAMGIDSKVCGEAWVTARNNQNADIQSVSRYLCPVDCYITKMGIYCGTSGNVKIHIYSGTSTAASDLLYANDTGTALSPGLNFIDIGPINTSAGDWLWIGAISDTAGTILYNSQSDEWKGVRSISYSTFTAPDPAASLTITSSTYGFKYFLLEEANTGTTIYLPTLFMGGGL